MTTPPCENCLVFPICKSKYIFIVTVKDIDTRILMVNRLLKSCPEFSNWYDEKYGRKLIMKDESPEIRTLFRVEQLSWL